MGVIAKFNDRLIDDWRSQILGFWTVRIALFWGAIYGLLLVWPAFAGAIPLWAFSIGGMVMSAAVAVARVTKQPGVEP
jgi:hypothetical protein